MACQRLAIMSNHLHIVLKTPEPNLARGMQTFLSGYANVWARRHKFSGHVFQGRCRTELIEDETYLWTVTRYVHLNPVRAGIAEHPADWGWSSYPGMFIGPAGLSGWLTTICWRRGSVRLVGRTQRERTGGM